MQVPGPKLTLFPESMGARAVTIPSIHDGPLASQEFIGGPFIAQVIMPVEFVDQQIELLTKLRAEITGGNSKVIPVERKLVVPNGRKPKPKR